MTDGEHGEAGGGSRSGAPGLVSVVIPVYNRAPVVADALASVRRQTYRPLQVVVVDDGSTDGTVGAVARWCDDVGAVPGLEAELVRLTHGGASRARNAGIARARGEFVAFLDSDDVWAPAKLEKQVTAMRASEAGLVCCGVRLVGAGGESWLRVNELHDGRFVYDLLSRNAFSGSSVGLIRRAVAEAVGGFDEALPALQEVDYWLRIAARFPVRTVAEPLVDIHMGTGPERISMQYALRVEALRRFMAKHADVLEAWGLTGTFERRVGFILDRQLGERQAARAAYLRALRKGGWTARGVKLLALSFVPAGVLGAVARVREAAQRSAR